MTKLVHSQMAIAIILVLTIIIGGFIWLEANKSYVSNKIGQVELGSGKCEPRAYTGEVSLSVWYVGDGNNMFVRIDDQDLRKLPGYDNTDEFKEKNSIIKIVDITPSILEEKIKKTSPENQQSILVKGFMFPCCNGQTPLAALEYNDGMFKKYLKS